jgi:glycosyltransferase involved in cell wall biosynthesis
MSSMPRVEVGVPVRNGERFLARQLESLLAQDFRDFEVIISDNGSTDATEEICRRYAERDARIRYYRSDIDRGLAWNWNRTFELSRAPYFKWAAHDDEHDPSFLSRCVAVLDADESVVCCHSASVDIDEDGAVSRSWPARPRLASPSPHVRFAEVLRPSYPCLQMFAVMRADALRRTGLHRPYPASDHVLRAELTLLGRIVELPEPLFRRREHSERSTRASQRSRWTLYTGAAPPSIPVSGLRLSVEVARTIQRSDVRGAERLLCWLALRVWVLRVVRQLVGMTLRQALTTAGRQDATPYVAHPRQLMQVLRAGKPAR